jgi:hypothetical protein
MRKALLLAIPLLVLACDRAPVAPTTGNRMSADFMNNPDNGNLHIWRSQYGGVAVGWTDPSNGLRAHHYTEPVVSGSCGTSGPHSDLDWQEIAWVDSYDFLASRFIANASGDVYIIVMDTQTPGTCFGYQEVAEGWGTMQLNDTDEIPWYPNDRHNVDSFGWTTHGVLTAPDGTTMQYTGRAHQSYNPDTGIGHGTMRRVDIH